MFAAVICATIFLAVLQGGESAVSWTTPSGGNGALATSATEQDVTSATNLADLTVTATATAAITGYTIATNPGSLFAVTGTTVGQLQLDADKGLDYEFQSVFVLAMTATDDTDTGTATVTINVSDEAADPVWGAVRYCVIVPDLSAAATEVTTITATVTTGTITYSLTDTIFEISSAGLVTIKASQSVSRGDAYQHALVVKASTTFTSTTILNICVGTATQCSGCGGSSSAAAAITFNIMTFFSLLLLLVL